MPKPVHPRKTNARIDKRISRILKKQPYILLLNTYLLSVKFGIWSGYELQKNLGRLIRTFLCFIMSQSLSIILRIHVIWTKSEHGAFLSNLIILLFGFKLRFCHPDVHKKTGSLWMVVGETYRITFWGGTLGYLICTQLIGSYYIIILKMS